MNVHVIQDAITLTKGVTTDGRVGIREHKQNQVETHYTQRTDTQLFAQVANNPVTEELGVSLQFFVDKETGKHVVKVLDPKSGDVIRQYPPEEFLQFVKNIRNLKGAFFSARL